MGARRRPGKPREARESQEELEGARRPQKHTVADLGGPREANDTLATAEGALGPPDAPNVLWEPLFFKASNARKTVSFVITVGEDAVSRLLYPCSLVLPPPLRGQIGLRLESGASE